MTQPRELGGYRLRERIAIGGMAEIYRAVREGPGQFAKTVAIKMVLPELGRDPEFVEMFVAEARLAAQLSSPNLVQVFDFGEEHGAHYLVMEHVDGLDLGALLARGPLAVELAVHVARQLCGALGDLHRASDDEGAPLQIVHRDVTPGNVLLSVSGEVKLGDFGIAKEHARTVRTAQGAIKGKLAYLSPEQARGEPLDQRADLYGLGLVLFEMLTGARYLGATTSGDEDPQLALIQRAAAPERRSAAACRQEVSAALDAVVCRTLEPEPARRFASAEQLDRALRDATPGADAGELRRALGALVDKVGQKTAPAGAAGAIPAPAAEPDRPAEPPKKGTEVLEPRDAVRRWPMALGVGAVLLALGSGAWLLRLEPPPLRTTQPDAALADASATVDRGPVLDVGPADAALSDHATKPDLVAGPSKGHRRPARRRPIASPATPAKDASAPPPDAAAPRPTEALRAQLDAISHTLAKRGILAADAPALFAERRAVAEGIGRGDDPAALRRRLAMLETRAEQLPIDRRFIDAKLRRIDRALSRAPVDASRRKALRQRARRALSFAVTRRYAEANRELNHIARAIAR